MPVNVPQQPGPQRLRSMAVANPISAGHGDRWAQCLNYLLAYCVEAVGSSYVSADIGGIGHTNRVSYLYSRSPGVKVLLVAVRLADANPGTRIKVTVSLPGAVWVTGQINGLDGSVDLSPPDGLSVRVNPIIGLLDVSGVTANIIKELRFDYSETTAGQGLQWVHAAEVPLADLDPLSYPLIEVGAIEPTTRDRIVDGSASVGQGFDRVISQLDLARTQVKRHMQLATVQDTSLSWFTTSLTNQSINWRQVGGSYDIVFRSRVRRLYDINSSNQMTWGVIYRTTDAITGGVAYLKVTPVGLGSTTYTLTLPATTTWTIASMSVAAPVNGTSQVCEFNVHGLINTSPKTLYLATSAIIENES